MMIMMWCGRFSLRSRTFLCVMFCLHVVSGSLYIPPLECDFYNRDDCDKSNPDERCLKGTMCDPAPNRNAYCMVQWKNDSNVIKVEKKGCWGEDPRCVGRTGCYEDIRKPDKYFCCCEGSHCNTNFSYQEARQLTAEDVNRHNVMTCEYYDPTECPEETVPNHCNKSRSAPKHEHCYAFLQNISGELVIRKKGNWLPHGDCVGSSCILSRSVVASPDPYADSYFCCCTGSFCNVDVEYMAPGPDKEIPEKEQEEEKRVLDTVLYSILPLCIIFVFTAVGFWCYRRKLSLPHEPLPTMDPNPMCLPPPSPITALRPIQLLQVKAKGRFGCVWKASMGNETVAVKIFPPQDRESFRVERDIYQLQYFSSTDSILRYIGGEKRGDSPLSMEMWLVTEYHRHGSLYDYLKGNLVSWNEAIKMSECITNGLTFLHSTVESADPTKCKPTVVHRDFKSKNVLIKDNMTACIADFGLAMKFYPSKHIGDTHGQVGTRRYMAPEVLEGSVSFNSDQFTRIDMYACGLVMWEIMSRCSACDGPVEEYQLPFEDEVGQHPTLEDMQEVVAQKKKRPPIRKNWLSHPGIREMCQSMQDCWDSDPEARLSAGCVAERIAILSQANLSTSPLLSIQIV